MGSLSCSHPTEHKEEAIETIAQEAQLQRKSRKAVSEVKDTTIAAVDGIKLEDIANEVFNIDLKTVVLPIVEEIEAKVGEYHLPDVYEKNSSLLYKELLYKDDSVYLGTINRFTFQQEGSGVLYYPDRSKYTGCFYKNEPHGKGRIIYPDGAFYEGQFKEGVIHGYGKYSYQNYLFIGNWRNELKEGYGEEFYEDGMNFKGNYLNDKKNGIGKLIWPNGRIYEGNFTDSAIDGIGKMIWPDDKISLGHWSKGVLEGVTVFYWLDDQRYIGEYSSFQKNGFGIFYWSKDKIYQGTWINGMQHGYGLIKDSLSASSNELLLSEYRFGLEINQITANNENYAMILKEINEKAVQVEAYVKAQFGIDGIDDSLFYKKLLQFQLHS